MKRFALIAATCLFIAPVAAEPVATVNGQEITQQSLDSFVDLLVNQGATDSEELREQVKNELIHRTIAVQAAEKAGIDKKDSVQQEIELARQGILVRALMADHLESHPITDETIEAEYEKLKAQQPDEKEYRVRHILVAEEDEAKTLIADIKADKVSFKDAAEKESIDTGSGNRGGDLGWAPPSNYVPEFADAVKTQGEGMVDQPVQSQFGWHIIEVQESREPELPALDELKPQIEEQLRQRSLAEFQQNLTDSATIDQ